MPHLSLMGRAFVAFVAFVAVLALSLPLAAQDLVPPRVLDRSPPPYPADGEGSVVHVLLELELDAEGHVLDARPIPLAEAPSHSFVETALAFVEMLRFAPATRDGSPIPARIRFDVLFSPPNLAGMPGPSESDFQVVVPPHMHGPDEIPEHTHTAADLPEQDYSPDEIPTHTHPGHTHTHTHERPEPEVVIEPDPYDGVEEGVFNATASVASGTEGALVSAASDHDLRIGALRDVPRRRADEMLTLAPGVVLANHSGEGHASAIFLRGFDAGEGQDVEMLVAGVPINEPSNPHGHGYADTSFVIPELVESIRVVEGPFDPRQSDFAVAGSVEYHLGVEERGLRAHVEYGRFDEKRMLLLYAPEDAHPGTFVAVDARDGLGYGPNRAHSAISLMSQYEHRDGPLRLSVLFTSHAQRFDSAGVVRADDVDEARLPCAGEQFFCTPDPNQGGAASRHLISGTLEWRKPGQSLSQQVFASLRTDRFTENFTGYLLDDRGDGLDELAEYTTVGARGAYRVEAQFFGQPQDFEMGYIARHDEGRGSMWRRRRDDMTPYATVFDHDLAITQAGAYALADLRFGPRFSLRSGVRLDTFAFSVIDRDRPTTDRDGERLPSQAQDALGISIQPRITFRAGIAPGLSSITSVGLGSRSSDATALSDGESAPFARVGAAETGLVYAYGAGTDVDLDARVSAYYTHVTQDLVFDPQRGRNVPVSASNRYGVASSARLRLGRFFDTMASVTYAEARLLPETASFYDVGSGNQLPFVPRWVTRFDGALRDSIDIDGEDVELSGSLGVTFIGPKPLPLDTLSQPIFTADAAVRARWEGIELGFLMQNLFDIRNRVAEFNYPSNFRAPDASGSLAAERHYAAGPPRTFFFTLTGYLDTASLISSETP